MSSAGSREMQALALVLSLAVVSAAGASPPAVSGEMGDIAVGHKAPDFRLESSDGTSYGLSDLRGEKDLVLIFWRGTW